FSLVRVRGRWHMAHPAVYYAGQDDRYDHGLPGAASAGNWTGLPGGSHKGPFGPKIAGRTRALNSSSVRYRSAPLEQAVASWSSADRSSGWSGTGGSAVAQRLTATCAAAVTAPARTCGYMSCSTSIPVLAAIASARTSCIAELTFRYSPRMAGAVGTSLSPASHSLSGAWSAPSKWASIALTRASHSGSRA